MDLSTSVSKTIENIFLFVFRSSFVSFEVCIYVCSGKSNSKQKYLLELIKRRSKIHQRNMQRECGLNFDQWKLSKWANKRLVIFCLQKIAENNWVHSKLKEVSYLPRQNKYSKFFFCELNSLRTNSLGNISNTSLGF